MDIVNSLSPLHSQIEACESRKAANNSENYVVVLGRALRGTTNSLEIPNKSRYPCEATHHVIGPKQQTRQVKPKTRPRIPRPGLLGPRAMLWTAFPILTFTASNEASGDLIYLLASIA